MRKKVKASFDPKEFLAKVGEGKRYPNIGRIKLFSRRERSRTPSFPSKARKRWLQSWDQVTSLAKDVSMAIRCASQQRGRSMNA